MPRTKEILFCILPTAADVSDGLLLRRRWMHLGQRACPEELGKLVGIASVGLDSIARLDGNQRRSHDLAHDALTRFLEKTLESESNRPRLIAAPDLALARIAT
jgi:hypothetical protein